MWGLLAVTFLCLKAVAAVPYRPAYGDPKIYTFAFTGIEPGSLFNGDELVGARVELMKEVCCRASKRCEAALVDFERCWNEDRLSEVLNGRWYDVCLEVSDTPRRRASYSFSDIEFFGLPNPIIVVRPGSNITLDDLRDPRNDFKVAFLSNRELATSEVMKNFLKEFFTKPENQIPLGLPAGANKNVEEILRLINDPCSGVDVGLIVEHLTKPGDSFKVLGEVTMELGTSTIMVRKDDQYILDWWDFTLKRFMCSEDYQKFCDRLDKELGAHPLNCPDASQVDCSDCDFKRRVEACGCR